MLAKGFEHRRKIISKMPLFSSWLKGKLKHGILAVFEDGLMIWVLLGSKWSFDHEIKYAFRQINVVNDVGDFGRISKQLKTMELLAFGFNEIPIIQYDVTPRGWTNHNQIRSDSYFITCGSLARIKIAWIRRRDIIFQVDHCRR